MRVAKQGMYLFRECWPRVWCSMSVIIHEWQELPETDSIWFYPYFVEYNRIKGGKKYVVIMRVSAAKEISTFFEAGKRLADWLEENHMNLGCEKCDEMKLEVGKTYRERIAEISCYREGKKVCEKQL